MERIQTINKPDQTAYLKAKRKWDNIAKPLGSFGDLEELIQQIAAIQGTADVDISKRTAVIFCADHGIVSEGVTQCGSEVTAICAKAIAEGTSNVNTIARTVHSDVIAVDIGMNIDVSSDKIINRKSAYGTRNFTKEPAMTDEQMIHAVKTGIDIVGELKDAGTKIIISGEMGIGNTTPASAIASVLLQKDPKTVTGRGAGLTNEGLNRKIITIQRGIQLHHPTTDNPFHLLKTLGGLDIAGMTGLFLGGAVYHVPIVIDGVISAAAAAIAYKLNPLCSEYMLASHCSEECAAKKLLDMMNKKAIVDAKLRLGEGTGGLLLLPLLDTALALYNNAHTFEEEQIERYQKLS